MGKRIEKQLLRLGFRRPDGTPDVGKFLRATGWDGRYFYAYLAGRTPSGERLDKLCADLKTSPAYLLMGVDAPLGRGRAGSRSRGIMSTVRQRLVGGRDLPPHRLMARQAFTGLWRPAAA